MFSEHFNCLRTCITIIESRNDDLFVALRDLVPFLQFKNVKNTHGGVLLLVKLQALACFSRFLNCAHGTKSLNAPHLCSDQSCATGL